MRTRLFAALVAALSFASSVAIAQYPDKPIEIVVPFAAGGGTDIMARVFADGLSETMGVPVVVVNATGAGGEIGMASVASGPADGYRLVVLNTPNVLTIPIERRPGFTWESFDLLGTIADDPATVSVLESSPIDTIEDLVRAARTPGQRLTYGSSGVGSAGHIAMLLLQEAAGIEAVNIPYDGSSAVRNGLMNGDVAVATANLGEALTFAQGTPEWRILGVMSSERVPGQPEISTFAEAGYPVTGGSLRGLGLARGAPAEVLGKLREAMARVMTDPRFLAAAAKAQIPVRYLDAVAYRDELSANAAAIQATWNRSPWQ